MRRSTPWRPPAREKAATAENDDSRTQRAGQAVRFRTMEPVVHVQHWDRRKTLAHTGALRDRSRVRPSPAGGRWLRAGTGVNQQSFFVPDRVAWNPVLAPAFTVDEIKVLQGALKLSGGDRRA